MRKSSLDVKPHYHTQERHGNPRINVMIPHTSRAEARQSGKSYRQWIAQWPLLNVLCHPFEKQVFILIKLSPWNTTVHDITSSTRNKPIAAMANQRLVSAERSLKHMLRKKQLPGLKTHHTDHGDVRRNKQWTQQPTRQDV